MSNTQERESMIELCHVKDLLDGKDAGEGVANQPWEPLRRRILALMSASSGLKAVIAQERETFEAWGLEFFNYGFKVERDGTGDYLHDGTNTAWYAWQARASLSAPPATPDMLAICKEAMVGDFAFPPLPPGIVMHPQLKDLFDRFAMQQYGLRVAEAMLKAAASAIASRSAPPAAMGVLTDERIEHLWDVHVGFPTKYYPLTCEDVRRFSRLIEAEVSAAMSAPQEPRNSAGEMPTEHAHRARLKLTADLLDESAAHIAELEKQLGECSAAWESGNRAIADNARLAALLAESQAALSAASANGWYYAEATKRIAELTAALEEAKAALVLLSKQAAELSYEARGLNHPSAPLRQEACGDSPEQDAQ